jgi:hypothetical protein
MDSPTTHTYDDDAVDNNQESQVILSLNVDQSNDN